MTRQELFNKVAVHLLTQNRISGTVGACRYRGEDGTRCAVGCLIPDDKYEEAFEGWSVMGHLNPPGSALEPEVRRIQMAAGLEPGQMFLVRELQKIHDNHPPDSWRTRLKMLAVVEGLSTLAVD